MGMPRPERQREILRRMLTIRRFEPIGFAHEAVEGAVSGPSERSIIRVQRILFLGFGR